MKTTRVRQHKRRTRSGTTGVVKHERRTPEFLRIQDIEQRGVKFKMNYLQTIGVFKNEKDMMQVFPHWATKQRTPALEKEYQTEDYLDKYYAHPKFKKSTHLFIGEINNREIQTGIDREYYRHFKKEGYSFYMIDDNQPLIARKGSKFAIIAPRIK